MLDPNSTEAACLGACLLGAADLAVAKLTAEDFQRHAHRLVFEAIRDLHGDGRPTDTVTVAEILGRRGHLESVGGPVALHDLMAHCPTQAAQPTYVDLIADHARRRQLAAVA
jgi:replicative DNA helicase